MKSKVEKKLFYLMTGEFVASVLFAILWVVYIPLFDWSAEYLTSFPPIYAFFVLEFILLQGSLYWYLKWKRIKKKEASHLSLRQLKIFSYFKRVNFLLVGVGLIVLLYQVTQYSSGLYWFLFLYGFAAVEHINYYHVRLSYQSIEEIQEFIKQKGLRPSILARELKKQNERGF
ncbi:hypothetical protein ACLM5H_24385 [Fredinandcohnia humi]